MQDLRALKTNSEKDTVILCLLFEDTYCTIIMKRMVLVRTARKILTVKNEDDGVGLDIMVDKDTHSKYEGMVLVMTVWWIKTYRVAM